MALVDGDAFGLDILSVYKYGSVSMRHESAKLVASRVEWIGVWASELARKELQHMLHTRRKAEIEILSTAQVAPRAQGTGLVMHTDMTQVRNSDTNGKVTPPLLHYLLGKISRCVANAT
ncbi:hypothetical protein HWV62_18966 [Athelia sp. TMB]|nr:hypothetical protein HWV62_18966 [Athelia sp. TMB]